MSSTACTAERFRKIWILNRKTAAGGGVDVVDFRAIEVRIKLFLRYQHYVIKIILCIDGVTKHGVEVECVVHSATPAANNTDSQKRIAFEVLRFPDPLYFAYCCRGY